ncbi:hypothetical protein HZH66_004733 [Vespula vulgaris]|uniref:Uncharacterized protein n=1 Tax=Vespula vulgaris TaxID=7454 RepID=A0A834KEI5_VESVU|nr:hypothetical protein HZH66_004733 [Vespula vulgaris]
MIIRLRIPSDEQIVSEQCTVLTSLTSKLLVADSPSPRIAKNVSLMLPTKIERHKADRDLQQNHMKPYCLQVPFSEKLLCTEQNCNYRVQRKFFQQIEINNRSIRSDKRYKGMSSNKQKFVTGTHGGRRGGTDKHAISR